MFVTVRITTLGTLYLLLENTFYFVTLSHGFVMWVSNRDLTLNLGPGIRCSGYMEDPIPPRDVRGLWVISGPGPYFFISSVYF